MMQEQVFLKGLSFLHLEITFYEKRSSLVSSQCWVFLKNFQSDKKGLLVLAKN